MKQNYLRKQQKLETKHFSYEILFLKIFPDHPVFEKQETHDAELIIAYVTYDPNT